MSGTLPRESLRNNTDDASLTGLEISPGWSNGAASTSLAVTNAMSNTLGANRNSEVPGRERLKRKCTTTVVYEDNSDSEFEETESLTVSRTRAKNWTDKEDTLLRNAVAMEGEEWEIIAEKCFAGVRNGEQCRKRWSDKLRRSVGEAEKEGAINAGVLWSQSEDKLLRDAVAAEGTRSWKVISEKHFKGLRTTSQCQTRWYEHLKPGIKNGPFTIEEDETLVKAVAQGMQFKDISELLPGRRPARLRERWEGVLDPSLTKSPWTQEEDRILIRKKKKLGKKWTLIAKHLPGRSKRQVRHRWKCLQRTMPRNAHTKANAVASWTDQSGSAGSADASADVGDSSKTASDVAPVQGIETVHLGDSTPEENTESGMQFPGIAQLPSLSIAPWTGEENKYLFEAQEELGVNWVAIAGRLPNRSERQARNHWNCVRRSLLRNAQTEADVDSLLTAHSDGSDSRFLPTSIAAVRDGDINTAWGTVLIQSEATVVDGALGAVESEEIEPRWTNIDQRVPLKKRKHHLVNACCCQRAALDKICVASQKQVKKCARGTQNVVVDDSADAEKVQTSGETRWTEDELLAMMEARSAPAEKVTGHEAQQTSVVNTFDQDEITLDSRPVLLTESHQNRDVNQFRTGREDKVHRFWYHDVSGTKDVPGNVPCKYEQRKGICHRATPLRETTNAKHREELEEAVQVGIAKAKKARRSKASSVDWDWRF